MLCVFPVQSVVGIDPELSRGELAVSLLRPVAVLCALHLYRFGFAGPPRPGFVLRLAPIKHLAHCVNADVAESQIGGV